MPQAPEFGGRLARRAQFLDRGAGAGPCIGLGRFDAGKTGDQMLAVGLAGAGHVENENGVRLSGHDAAIVAMKHRLRKAGIAFRCGIARIGAARTCVAWPGERETAR